MGDLKCCNCGCEFEEIDMIDKSYCPQCGSENFDFTFDLYFDEEK